MTKSEMREAVLAAKAGKGLDWEEIAARVGCAPVFLCAACLGEHSLTGEQAQRLAAVLDLDDAATRALTEYPVKGQRGEALMNDPLVYRFKEITLVYGEAIKLIVQEKFGDGIMSASTSRWTWTGSRTPRAIACRSRCPASFCPINAGEAAGALPVVPGRRRRRWAARRQFADAIDAV